MSWKTFKESVVIAAPTPCCHEFTETFLSYIVKLSQNIMKATARINIHKSLTSFRNIGKYTDRTAVIFIASFLHIGITSAFFRLL